MMKEEQTVEMKKLIRKIKRNWGIILYGFFVGDYDKALKIINQTEEIIKIFQGNLPEEIKELHANWLFLSAFIYGLKGNLVLNLKSANELLRVAKLYNDKMFISGGLLALRTYYSLSGDLDEALLHVDRAIRLSEENLNKVKRKKDYKLATNLMLTYKDYMILATSLMSATIDSTDIEDPERAKKYLKRLEEIRELKLGGPIINDYFRLAKGYFLKSSMRSRDRVMAEVILREIMREDNIGFFVKLTALFSLCELLLVELKISNDITIIEELKLLLEKLIGMAQHSGLYFFLIEGYILHGKLALIVADIESARHYFTQARRMAEKYSFTGLAKEIAGLHESMLDKKDTWKQMKKINAFISDRMELARLDDHLKGKFRMRAMKLERADDSPPKKEVF